MVQGVWSVVNKVYKRKKFTKDINVILIESAQWNIILILFIEVVKYAMKNAQLALEERKLSVKNVNLNILKNHLAARKTVFQAIIIILLKWIV